MPRAYVAEREIVGADIIDQTYYTSGLGSEWHEGPIALDLIDFIMKKVKYMNRTSLMERKW